MKGKKERNKKRKKEMEWMGNEDDKEERNGKVETEQGNGRERKSGRGIQ